MLVVLLVFVALFGIATIAVNAETGMWPPVEKSAEEFKLPQGKIPGAPFVEARSAVLMDEFSGNVLFEKNAGEQLAMASTTKMMTALVAREQLEPGDIVSITPEAAAVGEQELWLEPGEQISVEDLLWALLVHSANDAAMALAQYTSGSVEGFAALMNEKAAKLGADNSHFKNPHGLDEEGHYSTAYDLALIGRELLSDPLLADMVKCSSHPIPKPGSEIPWTCLSHNHFLKKYPGATGIKTGYTLRAGPCLVASACRDGKSMVAVALNSEHRDEDVMNMLEFGFANAVPVEMVNSENRSGRVRVSAYPRAYVDAYPKDSVTALTVNGSRSEFRVSYELLKESPAKTRKGDVVGEAKCSINGRVFAKVDIVTVEKAESDGITGKIMFFIWYVLCWIGRIVSAPVRIFT
ncbi:MAG: D-alanyl-D-alanine carboxypeptidase [Actinobacteria bacterium]|nr:D-alanyl-D-alanine carboxypeptidase [Actinomycetota bacterium]